MWVEEPPFDRATASLNDSVPFSGSRFRLETLLKHGRRELRLSKLSRMVLADTPYHRLHKGSKDRVYYEGNSDISNS